MADNLRSIKKRIGSVESLEKTANAMELVSSSKISQYQKKIKMIQPYYSYFYSVMADIANESVQFFSKFAGVAENVKKSCYVIIAGDRGMAGSYNANVFRLVGRHMEGKNPVIIAIGKKACDYYRNSEHEIIDEYPYIAEESYNNPRDVYRISKSLKKMFTNNDFQEVFIVYTNFISVLEQNANIISLLPVYLGTEYKNVDMEFEPGANDVFAEIIDEYILGILGGAILESYISEQGARQTAMRSARDNANEMIDELHIKYNRIRQSNITNEINEIVAGSLNKNNKKHL